MKSRIALVAFVFAFVAIACGDDTSSSTTVGTDEPVVFGEGEIPSTIPADFPIPRNSSVGTTLVDRVDHRTEFRLNVSSDLETTIRFFQVGLVNQGYVINTSEGSAAEWTMTYSRGELRGSIFSTPQGGGSSSLVVVSLNVA